MSNLLNLRLSEQKLSARPVVDYTVPVGLFDGIFDHIATPAATFTPRTSSEPSSYFSDSSLTSTEKDKKLVHVPPRVLRLIKSKDLVVDSCGIVRWSPDGSTHPRRWPLLRKLYDSVVICIMQFFMTMISNIGSPLATSAVHDFNVSVEVAVFVFTTLYLLGQALGGLVLPPVYESFGGRTIYVTSALSFAIFSFIMAAAPTLPVIVVFRILTGFISAMPAVVAAGTFENMWDMRSRAFTVHLWICGSIIGLAVGPPVATYISTSSLQWHWIFYLSGYFSTGLFVLCLFIRESRPSRILRNEVKAITRKTDFHLLSLESQAELPSPRTFIKKSLVLPVRLFFTEPIVTLTAVLAATACGLVYLFSDALSIVYEAGFGYTPRHASLTSLAFGVGVVFTLLPRIVDVQIMNKRRRQNRPLEPEDKLFGFSIAAPALAIGLWWFSLTVPPLITTVSPWASTASMLLLGFSVVEFGSLLAGYLCDSYTAFAASANAPMAFLRAILSGVFPLVGRQFFHGLGANYALFILASIATLFCAVPVVFQVYGKAIRQRSPFAGRLEKAAEAPNPLGADVESASGVGVPERAVLDA